MRRTICKLFGCELDMHDPCCHHCGAYLYDDFLQVGKLEPIFKAWRWLREHSPRWVRCQHCGKRLGISVSPLIEIDFCSDECSERWIPF